MFHEETIEKIIKAYYKVHVDRRFLWKDILWDNTLGHGFLEKSLNSKGRYFTII